jgi:hypothetical protein
LNRKGTDVFLCALCAFAVKKSLEKESGTAKPDNAG